MDPSKSKEERPFQSRGLSHDVGDSNVVEQLWGTKFHRDIPSAEEFVKTTESERRILLDEAITRRKLIDFLVPDDDDPNEGWDDPGGEDSVEHSEEELSDRVDDVTKEWECGLEDADMTGARGPDSSPRKSQLSSPISIRQSSVGQLPTAELVREEEGQEEDDDAVEFSWIRREDRLRHEVEIPGLTTKVEAQDEQSTTTEERNRDEPVVTAKSTSDSPLHSPMISLKAHLQPMSPGDTQSHHPSTLARSPHTINERQNSLHEIKLDWREIPSINLQNMSEDGNKEDELSSAKKVINDTLMSTTSFEFRRPDMPSPSRSHLFRSNTSSPGLGFESVFMTAETGRSKSPGYIPHNTAISLGTTSPERPTQSDAGFDKRPDTPRPAQPTEFAKILGGASGGNTSMLCESIGNSAMYNRISQTKSLDQDFIMDIAPPLSPLSLSNAPSDSIQIDKRNKGEHDVEIGTEISKRTQKNSNTPSTSKADQGATKSKARQKSLSFQSSGARIKKAKSQSVSRLRHKLPTVRKKNKLESSATGEKQVDAHRSGNPIRRISSNDELAKLREVEGEGKRRSGRVRQRRSIGLDVTYKV